MDELLGCKHQHRSFVESGAGMGERHSVHVCKDCGEIMIFAAKEGVHFSLNFHIHDPAQLAMMKKWTDYVWADYDPDTLELSK